ncbi:MAG: AMP-binding protein [Bacteroidales bacterium]|nr:AMP-binding protein [Bacteroidales bacterium]
MALLKKLYKINLASPKGILKFAGSALKNGVNLLAMLNFAAKLYPQRKAITDDYKSLSYSELYKETKEFAIAIREKYDIKPKKKVAVICKNHISIIKATFAISGLGAELYLLNPEMSEQQFTSFINKTNFKLIIYDKEIEQKLITVLTEENSLLSYDDEKKSVNNITKNKNYNNYKLPKKKSGSIIVLTGGTSGSVKVAKRKPSIFDFLNPFFALLTKLDLDEFKSVYIAIPIYHGFGLSTLIISALLGSEMYLLNKFETEKAANLIEKHKIEVITLVPIILKRLLEYNSAKITSIKRIITGGVAISPVLVKDSLQKLGHTLFNLYGTSEAGFSVMATPEDLAKKPSTIGKPIQGVKLKIFDKTGQTLKAGQTGMISLKTKWSMYNKNDKNVATGDLGYVDKDGHLFLAGRADDMIVSGGENVYPIVVENVMIQHTDIEQVVVIGINDSDFGQRLKAFVVKSKNSSITEDDLFKWVKNKVARYEMPAKIEFIDEIPITPVGKIDRKALKNL